MDLGQSSLCKSDGESHSAADGELIPSLNSRKSFYLPKEDWEEKEATRIPPPSPQPQALSDKQRCGSRAATAQECRLATGDAFVDQDFDFNPTVFGPTLLGLIRCH